MNELKTVTPKVVNIHKKTKVDEPFPNIKQQITTQQ